MRLTRERFESLTFRVVEAILGELPPDLRAEAENVRLEIVEAPAPEQARNLGGSLLGLYEGVPLVYRRFDAPLLQPDRITLFQNNLQATARTEVELRAQIRKTLVHELGHFFGFDEEELRARGWG
jgi:predicted Zn-dependent protease with MMP-like domain